METRTLNSTMFNKILYNFTIYTMQTNVYNNKTLQCKLFINKANIKKRKLSKNKNRNKTEIKTTTTTKKQTKAIQKNNNKNYK